MNGSQGIPKGRGSHAQADVCKRIEVMFMTGIQKELCVRKVRMKEALFGGKEWKEGRLGFLSLEINVAGASFSTTASFLPCDLDEMIELDESWEQSNDVCLNLNFKKKKILSLTFFSFIASGKINK